MTHPEWLENDDDDPFTAAARLCDDDGIVRRGLMHHGVDYTCTGHAHFAGEHYRCVSPAHDGFPGSFLDALGASFGPPHQGKGAFKRRATEGG